MLEALSVTNGEVIFGKGEYIYKRVIDDFTNANYMGILTFNISKTNMLLLDELSKACKNGANAVVVTNIPQRFLTYFGQKYESSAKTMIDIYKQQIRSS